MYDVCIMYDICVYVYMMYINNISINVKQSNRSRVRRAPGQACSAPGQACSAVYNRTGAGTRYDIQQNNLIGRGYEVRCAPWEKHLNP